ncbi:uncharacterized protein LOC18421920 [Amborella trichopoda]|uniref:Uncharacterized protein n=1 Tax=Amborella trichopoda TaxID=13333 RepID=W1NF02_AMBTC|nr:uncharacterized protein LOC18421920 [Amborella trichopoda]ERM94018.1 hypothetical protein AMTR_s00136p00104320 [Amborella trichopoda]|eukprot:XP_006826781.1 uncharacterized protein LOC18421920 [Amborella trichopoda]
MAHFSVLNPPAILFLFLTFSLYLLFISLWKKRDKPKNPASPFECSISAKSQSNPRNLVVDIPASNACSSDQAQSPSPSSLVCSELPLSGDVSEERENVVVKVVHSQEGDEPDRGGDDGESVGDEKERAEESKVKKKKKRKKKGKKSKNDSEDAECREEEEEMVCPCRKLHDSACCYPFTSPSSAIQRKIKEQYDLIVKSGNSKGLTLEQVGNFVNCLLDAKTALQQKSEVVRRKQRLAMAKLMSAKADKSSFDRLCMQINRLDIEQKRLAEDTAVYNLLQEQLKCSPAYQKMLEIRNSLLEMKSNSQQLRPIPDVGDDDISFEDLLAQEKKDSFWQRNGKLRSCTT